MHFPRSSRLDLGYVQFLKTGTLPLPRQLSHVPIHQPTRLRLTKCWRAFLLQITPRGLDAPGLARQVRGAGAVLARLAARVDGAGLGDLGVVDGGLAVDDGDAGAEGIDELPGRLGGQVLVVVVVDLDHGRVDAGAEALDLEVGEEAVGRRLALLDAEVLLDRLDDGVGAAAAELAGGRCAGLNEEFADGRAVVHGVEGGDFVDAHRGHLEDAGHLVHDADRGESVLTLAKVEDGHDGGLLVLGRVALEELGDDGLILRGELEGNLDIVVGRVAVHLKGAARADRRRADGANLWPRDAAC